MKLNLIYSIFLSSLILAGCKQSGDSSISVVKFRKVHRTPNSLEYSDRPLSVEERLAAQAYFKKYNRFFLIDTSGGLYLLKEDNYGEGIKDYFWIVTDEIEDPVNRAKIFIPDSILIEKVKIQ